jgi:hypothetical protein
VRESPCRTLLRRWSVSGAAERSVTDSLSTRPRRIRDMGDRTQNFYHAAVVSDMLASGTPPPKCCSCIRPEHGNPCQHSIPQLSSRIPSVVPAGYSEAFNVLCSIIRLVQLESKEGRQRECKVPTGRSEYGQIIWKVWVSCLCHAFPRCLCYWMSARRSKKLAM